MNPKDLEAVGLEQEYIMEIFDSNRRISLEEACDIVDKLGLSFDYMLGMTDDTKKPALGAKDGLDMEIVSLVFSLPAKEKELALELLRRLATSVNKQEDIVFPQPTAHQATEETPTS
jgi:hypothetical protein